MTVLATTRPALLTPLVDAIPDELRQFAQWVVFRLEERTGEPKLTKVPYRADGRGKAASNRPQTWCGFVKALAAYEAGGFDGMGFMLTPTLGVVGVDIDQCLDPKTGALTPEAADIVAQLATYTERSVSGTGLRLFAK